ncbi:MAG TPA: RusA family crossover junction endodeoxyribonuclease [Gemmatimonadaceae bacterium]|nr:RusA family crossover junction endodeoxyribonuclease [Gemmatimonadaceae bacterium]
MNDPVRLVLPEPPSSNRLWRVCAGRAVKSEQARAYAQMVRAHFLTTLPASERRRLPFTGPVSVCLAWHRARRMGDLDNRSKSALDALRGLVFVDDKQVVRLTLTRHEAPKHGRLEVVVMPEAA